MSTTRTLLLIVALMGLLLSASGCRAGARRLNAQSAAPTQEVQAAPSQSSPVEPDTTTAQIDQPTATQPAPTATTTTAPAPSASPTPTQTPTIFLAPTQDPALQELLGLLDQLDRENQSADPLDDLP